MKNAFNKISDHLKKDSAVADELLSIAKQLRNVFDDQKKAGTPLPPAVEEELVQITQKILGSSSALSKNVTRTAKRL